MSPAARLLVVLFLGLAPLVVVPQLPQAFQPPVGALLGLVSLGTLIYAASRDKPWQRHQFLLYSFAAVGMFSLVLTHLPVGTWLGRPLMVEPSAEQAQAIVVLAAGVTYHGSPPYSGLQRVLHGIELLKAGRAPHLVISTGDRPTNGHLEASWVASITRLIGVPRDSLTILQGGITTTHTEARTVGEWLLRRGWRRVLLVTNGPHIYRAALCLAREGITIEPAPVQTAASLIDFRDHAVGTFDSAMHEWIGLAYYWARGYISFPFPKKKFSPTAPAN